MAEAAPVVVPVVRPNLTCRFYEERFPQLHEAVNTNVTSIGDMGAYVKLLEYNNVDGKLLLFLTVGPDFGHFCPFLRRNSRTKNMVQLLTFRYDSIV